MATGFIKECLHNVPGVEGEHIHSPEVRTFDTDDECIAIITAKFVRAAVDAAPGGAIVVYRCDDGTFTCALMFDGDRKDVQNNLDEAGVRAWLNHNHPLIFTAPSSNAVN